MTPEQYHHMKKKGALNVIQRPLPHREPGWFVRFFEWVLRLF
jgi:hypothetical protein